MPYVSRAQEAYFNANRAKLERQGVDVGEWNAASKGKKLPAKVGSQSHSVHPVHIDQARKLAHSFLRKRIKM